MRDPVADAHAIFQAGLDAVRPELLVERSDWRRLAPRSLDAYARFFVVAIGKAAIPMARGVLAGLPAPSAGGVIVVPHGHGASPGTLPEAVSLFTAGHPVPDESGLEASREVERLLAESGEDDLVLVLLSGGGSALLPAPIPGIDLSAIQELTAVLLESGLPIQDINTVRRPLSRLKGGGLADAAAPSDVLSLVVSDVVGDDPADVASGPTVSSATTTFDARRILQDAGLWDRVPLQVRGALESESPTRPQRSGVRTRIIGSNAIARAAAAEEASARGYRPVVSERPVTGEARAAGPALVASCLFQPAPACLIWGGETTVTVSGEGKGGRNQEMVLAAAITMAETGAPAVFLSAGTDGRDGPTDAAGGWATPETIKKGRKRGRDPRRALEDNDSYTFLDSVGGLLRTGPTHTNVMDLQIAIVL